MTNSDSGNVSMNSHQQHWSMAIAALAVGTAFFSLWLWLLPRWLFFRVPANPSAYCGSSALIVRCIEDTEDRCSNCRCLLHLRAIHKTLCMNLC